MYTLPKLPYWYDALEPYIDSKTMEIHYTKHHQAYCDKLNTWLENYPDYQNLPLEELVSKIDTLPSTLQHIVCNHGWWLLNHNLFWVGMTPDYKDPDMEIIDIISSTFWSIDDFKSTFEQNALKLFGSWWTWLEKDQDKLIITNYPNQENPLMYDKKPILWLDLREHAYYLKNQNRRGDYIKNRWNTINWSQVKSNLHW